MRMMEIHDVHDEGDREDVEHNGDFGDNGIESKISQTAFSWERKSGCESYKEKQQQSLRHFNTKKFGLGCFSQSLRSVQEH